MFIDNLIYDWNTKIEKETVTCSISLLDETLRDGLQSISAKIPSLEEKLELILLMAEIGVKTLDLGYPGASKKAEMETIFLAKEIKNNKIPVNISCAARTHNKDIQAVINVSQQAGIPIEVLTFLGSSPIRSYVENWDLQKLTKMTSDSVKLGINAGLPVSFVSEDTTRSHPSTLTDLFKAAANNGAQRFVLCDTVGHSTPIGVSALVHWVNKLIKELNLNIELDWHGHNDRGLALSNAITAIEAGCNRIHATAIGIGERTGNTAMDQLLVNLKLLGIIDNDLSKLNTYCAKASASMGISIPNNYPAVGKDAFCTATGVHAAAIVKALSKGNQKVADLIYSAVPASMIGCNQKIKINSMSGKSNIKFWLDSNNIQYDNDLIEKILNYAKKTKYIMSDQLLNSIVDENIYSRE